VNILTPSGATPTGETETAMSDAVDRLGDARTVLLCAPPLGHEEACTALLAGEGPVLFVTYTGGVDDRLARLGDTDREVTVVTVGESATGAAGVATETVRQPSDLTRLGIAVGDFLASHDDVTVCFDSVTTMLQYVRFETAFEFLHVVTGRVVAAGARAHFHVDPAAHEQTHLAALTSLCDARLTPAEDSARVRETVR